MLVSTNKILILCAIALALACQVALADGPWLFDGSTVRAIPSGLKSVGVCTLDVGGKMTSLAPGPDGYVLKSLSGNWVTGSVSGAGTVTSVGLSMPSMYSVSGSPITGSGTIAVTGGPQAITASTNQWIDYLSSGGIFHQAQPAFSNISGTATAAQLPNPTATTIGGVQAITISVSKWIDSIAINGIPHLSQPDFSDLSGAATAAQLPAPTTSAFGGMRASTASTSQWVDYLSTGGVPHTSQPAFTDISGQATAAQLPDPTATTKGGVKSVTSSANLWVDYISTGGVPHQSQVDFTNISGIIAAAQLPLATSSSIGAIKIATASTNKWIDYISSAGIPHLSQPDFSNISGLVAATQLPNPTTTTLGGVQASTSSAGQFVDYISSGGVPHLATPAGASATPYVYQAYHDNTCNWSRSSAAFGDPDSADATCAFVTSGQPNTNGFITASGTCSNSGGALPCLSMTPSVSGVVEVCAQTPIQNNTLNRATYSRLMENGLRSMNEANSHIVTAADTSMHKLCGFSTVTASQNVTYSIQLGNDASSTTIGTNSGTRESIMWWVKVIK